MQDIQFRAFYNGKMYTVRTLYFEGSSARIAYLEREGERGITCDDMEHMELMQYTDLRDKHGKRICEGDILDLVLGKHILEARRGSFSFQFFEIAQQQQKLLYTSDLKRLEIIGNIHEHPELLQRKAG